MKTLLATILGCAFLAAAQAADSTLTPAIQTALDAQKKIVVAWAADPVIVAAVKAQNEKGPIAGMDNMKWKAVPAGDPVVVAFQKNPAGEWLAAKLKAADGRYSEAFLNGAKGEKAAFVDKPSAYTHADRTKFEAPMKGKIWQGKPGYDESSQSYSVQIGAPVLDGGKPIGVLIVGVAMKDLGAK